MKKRWMKGQLKAVYIQQLLGHVLNVTMSKYCISLISKLTETFKTVNSIMKEAGIALRCAIKSFHFYNMYASFNMYKMLDHIGNNKLEVIRLLLSCFSIHNY